MFYCEKCKKEYGYPESMFKSFGVCEICGEKAPCFDVPSKLLNGKCELCGIHNVFGKGRCISCYGK